MTGRDAQTLRSLLIAIDTGVATIAAVSAYLVRFEALDRWLPVTGRLDVLPERYAQALPAAVLLLLLATAASGRYRPESMARGLGLGDVLRLALLSAAALSSVALLYWREFQYSRATVAIAAGLFSVGAACAAPWSRRLFRRVAERDRAPALLIGGGDPARRLLTALDAGGVLAGRVGATYAIGDPVPGAGAEIRDLETAIGQVAEGRWREVFVAVPAAEGRCVPDILSRLEQTTADVHVVPDFGSAVLVHASASVPAGLPLVSLRQRPLHGVRAAIKRVTDVALSAVLLVVLTPLLIVIALLVRVGSRGPALFGQERMGIDGTEFRMWKFRTMRVDAEEATGPVFARPGDPRVTRIGRVLRRLSLDELPQLWNVLRGEMSLVGPRPERRPFIEEFRRRLPGYMLRHTVKAGMTGWAQVHGLRGESSLEDRLRYDLEYVDRWSLFFDVEILGRTVVQVIVGRNAC